MLFTNSHKKLHFFWPKLVFPFCVFAVPLSIACFIKIGFQREIFTNNSVHVCFWVSVFHFLVLHRRRVYEYNHFGHVTLLLIPTHHIQICKEMRRCWLNGGPSEATIWVGKYVNIVCESPSKLVDPRHVIYSSIPAWSVSMDMLLLLCRADGSDSTKWKLWVVYVQPRSTPT